jgi:hypothetical protein
MHEFHHRCSGGCSMANMGSERMEPRGASDMDGKTERSKCPGGRESMRATSEFQWSEWSVLGSRDIDGQTREGERAGAKESMG